MVTIANLPLPHLPLPRRLVPADSRSVHPRQLLRLIPPPRHLLPVQSVPADSPSVLQHRHRLRHRPLRNLMLLQRLQVDSPSARRHLLRLQLIALHQHRPLEVSPLARRTTLIPIRTKMTRRAMRPSPLPVVSPLVPRLLLPQHPLQLVVSLLVLQLLQPRKKKKPRRMTLPLMSGSARVAPQMPPVSSSA